MRGLMLLTRVFGKMTSGPAAPRSPYARRPGCSRYDGFVDGLNRLPRPAMVTATLALFGYAMVAPEGFMLRMQALDMIPEPLWWLLGGIVGFYFCAREAHHLRVTKPLKGDPPPDAGNPAPAPPTAPQDP